jgi:type IV secretory pathway VirB2 component (pilin)
MPNIHLTTKRFLSACILCTVAFTALPMLASAATYDGGGIGQGLQEAGSIGSIAKGDLPTFIADVMNRAVNYATLAGVVVVVAAGFMLILGFGSDEWKEKAKKAIIYVCAGLLVLYFAQIIVDFFATAGASDIRSPIVSMMNTIVNYLTLAGVVTVFVAGLYLIFSFGNDENKEKAKKIIYYTLAGLFIVFMARVIVVFVVNLPAAG